MADGKRTSVVFRVTFIVSAGVTLALLVPAVLAVWYLDDSLWRDRTFVITFMAVAGIVCSTTVVFGRLAARSILEPLTRVTRHLEAMAVGDEVNSRVEVAVTELGRLDQLVRGLVTTAWDRERRFSTAVGALAHDVRASLTAIRGALASLEAMGLTEQQSDGTVTMMHGEIDRVIALTSDLVMVMRGQEIVGVGQQVSVAAVADSVVSALAPTAKAEVRLQVTKDFERRVPRLLIDRALRNVVENAVRVARSRVTVEVLEGLVVVADDGPGFPSTDGPRGGGVAQDTRKPMQSPEHGYGFEIASRLAELVGGRVVVERTSHTGSTVLVFL